MVLLSVVVPTFDVEDLVGRCLDSLLVDRHADIEVIAVDDASTDGSGEVLDGYARSDERVRVVHLEVNHGLGGARNVGLAHATGDFVWFVDADDWVASPALSAIAEKLDHARPDVLLLGHASVHRDRITRRTEDSLLTTITAPVDLEGAPHLVELFPSAWNRVFRREFLCDLDVPFPPGSYEDLPVTLPSLAAARSIDAMPRTCVYYRQRQGSIINSEGRHHLDVLDQYTLAFERLERFAERGSAAYAAVHVRLCLHLYSFLGGGRIGRSEEREFFERSVALARRSRVAPGAELSFSDTLRRRLLLSGSWMLIPVVRSVTRALRRVSTVVRRAVGAAKSVPFTATRLRSAGRAAYYRLHRMAPVDAELALFSAYWGRGAPSCNPWALHRRAVSMAPHVRSVWAVDRDSLASVPPGVEVVVLGSLAYYRALARAKFLFNNVNFGDTYVKRRGTVVVQTHHGTPLKAMGIDVADQDPGTATRLLRRCEAWDFSVASNAYSSLIWSRAYPVSAEQLETGHPRNDQLSQASVADVATARDALGVRDGRTIVAYIPTHRDDERDFVLRFDADAVSRSLGAGFVLAVRAHHRYREASSEANGIVDGSRVPIETLYLAADVLVTDYSSAMFDYAVLDRPIVIFAPDWERYREIRGTYFDLLVDPPGVVARSPQELIEVLLDGRAGGEAAAESRRRFRERFCDLDDGCASERVLRAVGFPIATSPDAQEPA